MKLSVITMLEQQTDPDEVFYLSVVAVKPPTSGGGYKAT